MIHPGYRIDMEVYDLNLQFDNEGKFTQKSILENLGLDKFKDGYACFETDLEGVYLFVHISGEWFTLNEIERLGEWHNGYAEIKFIDDEYERIVVFNGATLPIECKPLVEKIYNNPEEFLKLKRKDILQSVADDFYDFDNAITALQTITDDHLEAYEGCARHKMINEIEMLKYQSNIEINKALHKPENKLILKIINKTNDNTIINQMLIAFDAAHDNYQRKIRDKNKCLSRITEKLDKHKFKLANNLYAYYTQKIVENLNKLNNTDNPDNN